MKEFEMLPPASGRPAAAGSVPRRSVLKGAAAAAGAAAFGGTVAWSVANAPAASAATAGNLQALQQAFVERRFGMFIHFNMATFSDEEWATGGLPETLFNPTKLDPAQWAATARAAGMSWAALTTKHHDGFCLWPTKQTSHNVMNSSVKKDVVRLYVDAFRAEGLTPCIYFSIWDRTQGIDETGTTRADIDFIKNQLTELLGGTYGEIPVLIIDGWSWKMGHKAVPYAELRAHIKSLNPNLLIIDHNGQTEPWEEDAIYFEEPKGIWAPTGNTYASCQGQNIVNTGWFWHPKGSSRGSTADTATRTPSNIATDHIKVLEKRYCSFLLNCPPNNQGLLDNNIVTTLKAVGPLWKPDPNRAPLPAQPDVLLYPVSPVTATATSGTSTAGNAIDGMIDNAHGAAQETYWTSSGSLPQSVTMDLGATYSNIDSLGYLPRQDKNSAGAYVTTGTITGYRVLTSTDGTTFAAVASGTWAGNKVAKWARFAAVSARYVRLEATAVVGGGNAVVNEIDCGGITARPVLGGGTVSANVKIVNRKSGKALTIAADGKSLVQATDTGAAAQLFRLVDVGSGYAKLVNPGTANVVDVSGKALTDGAAVIVYRDTAGTNQQWTVTTLAGGYRKLVNRNSGKALDVSGAATADSAGIVQNTDNGATNQQWTFVAV